MSKHIIVVERHIKKTVDTKKLHSQLKRCAEISMKSSRGRGWDFTVGRIPDPKDFGEQWVYRVQIIYHPTSKRESLLEKWPKIVEKFAKAASAGPFRGIPWVVVEPVGYDQIAGEAKIADEKVKNLRLKADEPKELGSVTLDPADHFKRLFGREAHIRRIIDAIELAVETDFEKRNHSLLNGPPGCGKSEVMVATSKMLGKEGEAWLWFDATSMTRAGAIEELMKAEKVAPVLFIEEIEKTEESALRYLLGVMDHRGEVRRTNYRVGNQCRNYRAVIIATANDVAHLESLLAGALYSRFQQRIYCEPPNRAIMQRILEREIAEIKGDTAWIEPTLKFGFDDWCMRDPRNLITICTCGRNRLLDGSYQKDYIATMHPYERDKLLVEKKKLK